MAQAWLDILVTPWTVFGALTGGAMVTNHHLGFRINWYLGIALNILTIIFTYLWYHPPVNTTRHGIAGSTKFQQLLQLDWIGISLLGAGLSITLMGLGFGGITFPWKHAGVIAPIIIGVFLLITLGIYEWKFARHPFLAPQLFRQGRSFTMVLFITFIAGMGLYAASAFWTQQVAHMWTPEPIKIGVLTIPGGFGGARKSILRFAKFHPLTSDSGRFPSRNFDWKTQVSQDKLHAHLWRYSQSHR